MASKYLTNGTTKKSFHRQSNSQQPRNILSVIYTKTRLVLRQTNPS